MGQGFSFDQQREFQTEKAEELLRTIPAAPGIFALRGGDPNAQPYLTRAADLRRRLRRLLLPPEQVAVAAPSTPPDEPAAAGLETADTPSANAQAPPHLFSKRLNLRDRVRFVEWTQTGSEFESTLLLYHATRAEFGADRARERLKLRSPFVVRLTLGHEHPRLYVTNRLGRQALTESFGPFPSRAAAERYAEAVGDLFKLRRCYEDLVVSPEHPGCAYGEMKLCLAPCKAAVSAAEYNAEGRRAHDFLRTRGESLLKIIAAEREQASETMNFELAATLHTRWEKVRAAALLADEVVRPLAELRAVIVQEAAPLEVAERASEAAVFLLETGHLAGPERLSTLGVRAVREQTAVGSSLFAQPLMLSALPLAETPAETSATSPLPSPAIEPEPRQPAPGLSALGVAEPAAGPATSAPASSTLHLVSLSPEERASHVLQRLHAATEAQESQDSQVLPSPAELADTLALFRRWYYRPEKQRAGEVFLPNADGTWPIRRLLNGAARVVLGPPGQLSPADREAAREATKAQKTRVLHPGREGVERVVPVLPKRSRTRKAVLPDDVVL